MHTVVLAQEQSTPDPDGDEPSSQFSIVWAKALEIAKKKISDNNLPPLNLTNLTSPLAEENIQAVVEALNTLKEDKKEKRWRYTWHGKEFIVVEHWGKTLKRMEKYSPAVSIVIQRIPQVGAFVWASVWTIMRVCTLFGN